MICSFLIADLYDVIFGACFFTGLSKDVCCRRVFVLLRATYFHCCLLTYCSMFSLSLSLSLYIAIVRLIVHWQLFSRFKPDAQNPHVWRKHILRPMQKSYSPRRLRRLPNTCSRILLIVSVDMVKLNPLRRSTKTVVHLVETCQHWIQPSSSFA